MAIQVNVRRVLLMIGIVIILSLTTIMTYKVERFTLDDLNDQLDVEQIKLGMTEDEVIRLWGDGEYWPGFGGHARDYKDKMATLGFAGDRDNDLYGRVSTLTIKNSNFSVYNIHIGDPRDEANKKLLKNSFIQTNHYFERGEFMISLSGEESVSMIQVWFLDKDLRDRVY